MKSSKLLEPVGASDHQERRESVRVPLRRLCPYELSKFGREDIIELSDGLALSLNISVSGMLLLMPQATSERQVFEVHAPSLKSEEARTWLVEVCWTRELPVDVDLGSCLVGVRFLFDVPACASDTSMGP